MPLIRAAPVSIPFWTAASIPQGVTRDLVLPSAFTPAIVVIAGIDLTNPGFFQGSEALVQIFVPNIGNIVMFQAFVYATSQATFQWRGELPMATGNTLQCVTVSQQWDIHVWGAIIPNASIQP